MHANYLHRLIRNLDLKGLTQPSPGTHRHRKHAE